MENTVHRLDDEWGEVRSSKDNLNKLFTHLSPHIYTGHVPHRVGHYSHSEPGQYCWSPSQDMAHQACSSSVSGLLDQWLWTCNPLINTRRRLNRSRRKLSAISRARSDTDTSSVSACSSWASDHRGSDDTHLHTPQDYPHLQALFDERRFYERYFIRPSKKSL